MFLRLAELSDVGQAGEYAANFIANGEESPWSSDGGDYASWFVKELERRRGEGDGQLCPESTYLLFADNSDESELLGHMRILSDPTKDSVRHGRGCFYYAVKPDWRERGLGSALLACGRFLLSAGASVHIPVVCEASNLGAIRTIENNGSVFVGYAKDPASFRMRRRYYCEHLDEIPADIQLG